MSPVHTPRPARALVLELAPALAQALGLVRLRTRALAAALVGSLAGCIVVPQTHEVYDPQCHVVTRHVTLETVQVAQMGACANQGCAALVLAAGVGVAASTVVSGSIALVGNVAYWAERQMNCRTEADPPAAAAGAPR